MTNKYNNTSIQHQSFVYTQLNNQIVLFQIIYFSRSHLFALSLNVKQYNLTPSSATAPGQSEPGSAGKEGVFCIPQSSSVTGASQLDCLMS